MSFCIFRHEYQIFQKVCRLDYETPEGFNSTAQDLVRKLLVSAPLPSSPVHVIGSVLFFCNKVMFEILLATWLFLRFYEGKSC